VPLQTGVAVQKSGERNDKAGFATTVWASPRECTLSGFGHMPRHRGENFRRGLRTYKAVKGIGVPKVGVNTDRSQEAAGNADVVFQRHQAATFPSHEA